MKKLLSIVILLLCLSISSYSLAGIMSPVSLYGNALHNIKAAFAPSDIDDLIFWIEQYGDDSDNFILSGSNVTQWNDLSSNANHIANGIGGTQPTLTSGPRVVDFSTSDTLFIADQNELDLDASKDFSVSIWVNLDEFATDTKFITKKGTVVSPDAGWSIGTINFLADSITFIIADGVGTAAPFMGSTPTTGTHHIVGTVRRYSSGPVLTDVKLYVDKVLEGSTIGVVVGDASNSDPLEIANPDSETFGVHDATIYDKELTTSEIEQLYDYGVANQ